METDWIDFRSIKAAVTMQMVLDRYGVTLKKSGPELRGNCAIHRGSDNKHFTVNVSKNVFKCFFAGCDAQGNVLDFVAAMEQCSVRDAAIKLRDWFKVGDSTNHAQSESASALRIETGIYKDGKDGVYEIIGLASHAESSESLVVYRELFGEYRLLVISTNRFLSWGGPLSSHPLTLVRNL